MKAMVNCTALLMILLLGSCAPKPMIVHEPAQMLPGAGDEMFSKAETLFHRALYEKALLRYQEFIDRYPGSPFSSAAMMKIGEIYEFMGQSDKSRQMFQQLITACPGNPLANDARINILLSFFREEKYQEVIRRASVALEDMTSAGHVMRTYILLGDTYMARESPVDAANFYLSAYHKSDPREKRMILTKLKTAFGGLQTLDIISLLSRMRNDELIESYLMYQLGLKYAEEEKYEKAVRVLSDFLQKFPAHEFMMQASNLIDELRQRAMYRPNAIGCLLPLSGPYEEYGRRALKGVELALSQFLNRSPGAAVDLVIKDSESKANKAVEAIDQFASEHMAAVIGPVVTAKSAALKAQETGIPIITLTQKKGIPQIGNYVFRHFITPELQVEELVDYAVTVLGVERFAVLYPEEPYGYRFMNLFWDRVTTMGATVTGMESYSPSHTDFADPIKRLTGLFYEVPDDLKPELATDETSPFLKTEPMESMETTAGEPGAVPDEETVVDSEPEPIVDFDAIFIPDSPQMAGLIIPQLAFHDVTDVYLLGTNLWHSDRLIDMARQYVQNALMPDGFFSGSRSPAVREFVAAFSETYGEPPGFMEAIAYDTAMMVFELSQVPEIQSRKQFCDFLLKFKKLDGVTGTVSFKPDGEAVKKLCLMRIKGKKIVELNN